MKATVLAFLLFLPALFASPVQDEPRAALFAKCDSEIAWISDGVEMPDCESLGHKRSAPVRKPDELFDEAKEKAAKEKKLILWYVPRQPGGHMNRATILDSYIKVGLFTDPDVVEVVNRSFVPLRCCLTKTISANYKIVKWEFVEPGFVFLTPDGEVVHVINRLRTFNADWALDVFRQVLAEKKEFAPKALPEAVGDYAKAIRARLARNGDAALKLLEKATEKEAAVEKGRVLMHMAKLKESREVLAKAAEEKSERQAEAIYWLAVVNRLQGQADQCKGLWERLAKDFPATPWAWRAAAELVAKEDTLMMGPVSHNFLDVFWPPPASIASFPTSTRWARGDADAAEVSRRAVEWLLLHQDSNGGWTDSRYVYCDSPKILPNVFVAVTSMACTALREWRDVDPTRIDAAIALGEKYILDEKNENRGQNEDCYADAYRLFYLARRQATLPDKEKAGGKELMNKAVAALAKRQNRQGFWAHEYPNSFCTAAVVQCLYEGKRAGATIEDAMLSRAVDGLKTKRSNDGRSSYDVQGPPSTAKNSSARNPVCESALFLAGAVTKDLVAHALDGFFENQEAQERIRVCDFHADEELGGFFFWHGFFHATQAARVLDAATCNPYLAKFRDRILKMPEFDGSFIDSHELGKSYGTAMALLSLKNTRNKTKEY